MMEYKGYVGRVDFDDEAGLFHGEVLNTRDVITFQGKSVEEIKKSLRDSIEDYLAFCKERGESPDKPFSGQFVTRMPPELHRRISVVAAEAQQSLNSWVVNALQSVVSTMPQKQSAKRARRPTKSA